MPSSARNPAAVAFLNGEYVPHSAAGLPVDDLGVTSGVMLTERLRTVRHVPYFVGEHLRRLQRVLDELEWTIPVEYGDMTQAIEQVVAQNVGALDSEDDLAISLLVTGGSANVNPVRPTVCITTPALPWARWREWWEHGVPLIVSEVQALPSEVIPSHYKHRSRLHWWLADQQAHAKNPRSMALLKDRLGHVTETSSGNLFIVRKGRLWTSRERNTLPGIAQTHVISLAKELGWEVQRADLSLEQVQSAEEAFLTSSTYCLLPVRSLDGVPIGAECPGKVTTRIIERWSREMGIDFRAQCLNQQH